MKLILAICFTSPAHTLAEIAEQVNYRTRNSDKIELLISAKSVHCIIGHNLLIGDVAQGICYSQLDVQFLIENRNRAYVRPLQNLIFTYA